VIAPCLPHLDWDAISAQLDEQGFAPTRVPLLDPDQCADLRAGFDDDDRYRATVVMGRHRFGEGTYRYFRHPLPPLVAALRTETYPFLAAVANRWQARLGACRFPGTLDQFAERCRRHGQQLPTPLILRYGPGGYNCLHQDRYGEVAFPLQMVIGLSQPGTDFTGGESIFVEQRPRAQSRATATDLPLGHGLIFANDRRPVRGARGDHQVRLRHGVSTVRTGSRLALGLIFHDAL
jgi:hypothetical protein